MSSSVESDTSRRTPSRYEGSAAATADKALNATSAGTLIVARYELRSTRTSPRRSGVDGPGENTSSASISLSTFRGYSTATPRAWKVTSPPPTAKPVIVRAPLASSEPPFREPVNRGIEIRSPSNRIGPVMSDAITRGSRITISASSSSTRPTRRGAAGEPVTRRSRVATPSTDIAGDSTESGRRPGVPVIHTSRSVAPAKLTLPPIMTGTPALNSTSSNVSTPPAIDM